MCSGKEVSLRDAAEQLAAIAGLKLQIIRDPGRMRPAEQKRMCGNPAKLRALGWNPGISFETTLRYLLADCRTRVHLETT